MTVTVQHITFDADDADGLARFWATLLERDVDPGGSREFATIGLAGAAGDGTAGPALLFIRVPELAV